MARMSLLPLRWSLRGRLTAILLIALLPAAVLAVMLGLRGYYSGIDFKNRALIDQARLFSSEIRTSIVEAESFIRLIAARREVRGRNTQACQEAFASAAELARDLSALAVFGEDGKLRCGWGAVDAFGDPSQARWFTSAQNGAPLSVSAVTKGGQSQRQQFLIAIPQTRESGRLGVMAAVFGVARFTNAFDTALASGTSNFALFDNANMLLIATTRDGGATDWLPNRPLISADSMLQAPAAVPRSAATGEGYHYVVSPVGPSGLYAVSGNPAALLYADEWVQLGGTIALPLALLLLAITTIWFSLDRLLIAGLQRLSRVVRRYGAGDYSARTQLPATASSELVDLQDSFNAMADSIEMRSGQLRAALEEHQVLLRELHHRVKNNFQLISSLINLRLPKLSSAEAAELRAIQDRVQAIATSYRIAYASGETGSVSMRQLANDLLGHFRNDPRFRTEPIRAQVESGSLTLDLDEAVPVGLLITEIFEQFAPRTDTAARTPITMNVQEEGDGLRMIFTGLPATEGRGQESAEYSRRFMRAFVQQLEAQLIVDTDKKTGIQNIDIYIPVEHDRDNGNGQDAVKDNGRDTGQPVSRIPQPS